MLTLETVFQSELAPIIINNLSCFTEYPIKILCLYLLYEKSKGEKSIWNSYIKTLPLSFTTTVCWNNEDISLLEDTWLIRKTMSRISLIESLYNDILPVLNVIILNTIVYCYVKAHSQLFPLEVFTLSNFKWAWCCFMTRSVFYDSNYVIDMYNLDNSVLSAKFRKENNYAMVPLLDGLNHTNIEVVIVFSILFNLFFIKVDGFFDKKTKTYNIVTHDDWEKGQQVFICYGNHSNATLLIEYGFIIPNNIHNCIKLKNVTSLFPELKCLSKVKEQWLAENNLLPDGNTKQ